MERHVKGAGDDPRVEAAAKAISDSCGYVGEVLGRHREFARLALVAADGAQPSREDEGPEHGKTEAQKAVYWFRRAYEIAAERERDALRVENTRLRKVVATADRHLRNTVAGMRYREPLPKSVIRAVELTQHDLAAALDACEEGTE
jgi:hypothetical protein